MLNDAERREIEERLAPHAAKRAGVISVLKALQRHRGWISDETIHDAAELLEMTPDEVDSVATFYSLIFRRQVGRHVILICDSVCCAIMGYESLQASICTRLNIELGGTTSDGRFTLLPVACIGACDHAPAMLVDGKLHGDLTPENVAQILEGYT